MNKRLISAFLLFSGCLWASALLQLGCSEKTPFQFEPQIVVFALFIAGHQAPHIKLEQSWGIERRLPEDGLGVTDADVMVYTGDDTVHYVSLEEPAGLWTPFDSIQVLPSRTYLLEVITTNDRIYGETTLPDTFRILQPEWGDTLNRDGTPVLIWTKSQGSAGYLIDISTPSGSTDFMGIVTASDTLLPILAFFFGEHPGDHTIKVAALDRNYYDHMMTMEEPGVSGQEATHIEGGLGVFGSCGVDSVLVYVR